MKTVYITIHYIRYYISLLNTICGHWKCDVTRGKLVVSVVGQDPSWGDPVWAGNAKPLGYL